MGLLPDVARAVQGVGGAAMFTTSLALIGQEFGGPGRHTAFALYGATIGGAVAIGPLLVSAFRVPEADWNAILEYLDRGGNLIVLGGKPFTRAGYKDASGWHLRSASIAQSLELFIDGYQQTPGSRLRTQGGAADAAADGASPGGRPPMPSPCPPGSSPRSSWASPSVAPARPAAPPSSAARATGSAPWP